MSHMVQANTAGAGWRDVQAYRSRRIAEAVAERLRQISGEAVECRVVERIAGVAR